MNKKGLFVTILSLLLVVGLIGIYLFLNEGAREIVRIYYTPADVLNNNMDIKEYEFDLNQEVKYSSFKAFNEFAQNGGLIDDNIWYGEKGNPIENIEETFKQYFLRYFKRPFDVNVEIKYNQFVISGKAEKKIFENFNVKTEIIPEFSYILDYDISIFEDLYENCNILSCDELEEKNCKILKNKCSSEDNYINMEYTFTSNIFNNPKILFRVTKPGVF